MAQMDYFQKLVGEEQVKLEKASISLPLGESHRHAEIKGMHTGLSKALELYRKATRIDIEADEAA